MGEIIGKVVVGKVMDVSIKPVEDEVKKALAFGEILKRVKSILELIGPIVHEIKQSSGEWDRPKEENEKLIQLFEEGEKLIRKHSKAHWLVNDWIYGGKITAFYDSLRLFFKYHIPLKQSKNIVEIVALLQSQSKSGTGGASGSIGQIGLLGKGQSGACSAPKPPDFMVGLDMPLRKLKKLVLEGDASLVVVTAPGGCGKTAFVLKLCQDPDVKGKFKANIFYLTVSKAHNLKLMAQKLFEHNHVSVPESETDEDAINHLKQLLENQAQKAPVLLVLDDVWGGPNRVESDFPLHKFLEFNIPECRILVTSRYKFPRVGSTYNLNLLDAEQAKKLLLHSALLTYEDKDLDDVVDKIVKRCSRFPLALKVIGGTLRGLSVDIWKSQLLEWSEGQSILDSEEDLLDCLQSSLASLKAKLKECFMDIGSFPDDKKIPVTALIDMWAELYKLDDNGVHAISNLHKLSLQNLLNLVVTRRDAMEDEGWYDDYGFVLQHDLLRDLAIRESSQEPMEERKRLILDLSGNKLPEWWSQENQPCIKARLLSISTGEMFCSSWCNIQAPEVEVLIINFQTKEKHYTLPESFIKQMVKLKVLVITNYGFSIPELTNFAILGLLSSLKRIRLERVSIPTLCNSSNAMVELKNLEKMTLVMCKINKAFLNDNSAIQIPEMLPKLREINLDSCNDLVGLPEWLCDLAQLRRLCISNCHKPSALPEGIRRLKNLEVLRLHACTNLEELPETIGSIQKLTFLDVSGCSRLRTLPEQMGKLCNLRKLYIIGCSRLMPPSSMDHLEQLKIICDPKMARHWEDRYNVIHSRNETTIDLIT